MAHVLNKRYKPSLVPTRSLDRMEAQVLVKIPGTFLVPGDRLLLHLEYMRQSNAVQIFGQEFFKSIDRRNGLDGILTFTDQEVVNAFLAGLPSA